MQTATIYSITISCSTQSSQVSNYCWLPFRQLYLTCRCIVEETDTHTVQKDSKRVQTLGSICVRFFKSRYTGRQPVDSQHVADTNLTVAEKALKGKAVSH